MYKNNNFVVLILNQYYKLIINKYLILIKKTLIYIENTNNCWFNKYKYYFYINIHILY